MPHPVVRNRRLLFGESEIDDSLINDNFESYSDLSIVDGLNGGTNWNGTWEDAAGPVGITDYDDFESYVDGVAINGLNGRVTGFPTAWVDATSPFNVINSNEDFESYSDGAAIEGLNGGTNWNGTWKDASLTPAQAAFGDWLTRVRAQGSDVTIAGTQTAVEAYIQGLMDDGVWSKIVRHSIYAGDGLLALNAPLKNGGPVATDALNNFVGGDYSQTAGLTGNTTTKYLNTGLPVDTTLLGTGDDSNHIAQYVLTASDESGATSGAYNGGTLMNVLQVSYAGVTYFASNNSTTGLLAVADSLGTGMYVGSRISSSSSKIYKNGTSIGELIVAGGARTSITFYVHAFNSNGTATGFTLRTLEMYSIGAGLTSTDVTNFTNRYATLRTALGR